VNNEKISEELFKEIFCLIEPNCYQDDGSKCKDIPCMELERAFKKIKEKQKLKSSNNEYAKLLERLVAVETIIGGISLPSREELDCAANELNEVIQQLQG